MLLPYVGNPVKVQRAYSSLKHRLVGASRESEQDHSDGDLNYNFDMPHEPEKPLRERLSKINFTNEIKRRLELYSFFEEKLKRIGCIPLFDYLPGNVVPYTFPFRCPENQERGIKSYLANYGIMMQGWPDFHPAAPRGVRHYEGVKFIDFVW